MPLQGEVPERCTPDVMRAIFRQHLESPTMWTIFPVQVTALQSGQTCSSICNYEHAGSLQAVQHVYLLQSATSRQVSWARLHAVLQTRPTAPQDSSDQNPLYPRTRIQLAQHRSFAPQDVMGLSAEYIKRPAAEETINDPTNPKHYWRYRMHVTVEQLRADRQLLADLQVSVDVACPVAPAYDTELSYSSSAAAVTKHSASWCCQRPWPYLC